MELTQQEVARRIANRGSRYERLLDLDAPDIILDDARRLIREAVDLLAGPETRPDRAE